MKWLLFSIILNHGQVQQVVLVEAYGQLRQCEAQRDLANADPEYQQIAVQKAGPGATHRVYCSLQEGTMRLARRLVAVD